MLDALAPTRARRYAASCCARIPPDVLDEVLLLTTELVNNAIWHGGGDAWLDIEVVHDHVTVGVTDDGGGEVRISPDYLWPESGHGLRLVDAMSDRWGVDPRTEMPGKRVWFERTWNAPRASAARRT